jgi:hypothetical protein
MRAWRLLTVALVLVGASACLSFIPKPEVAAQQGVATPLRIDLERKYD